jgi:hypothetical protein
VKKLISISIIIVYALLTVGVGVSKHFCGGYLADVEWFSTEKKTCQCSLLKKDKKAKDCCKDEIKIVKLDMSQDLVKCLAFDFLQMVSAIIASPFEFCFTNHIFFISLISWKIETSFPPPKSSLYLLFCVFRI